MLYPQLQTRDIYSLLPTCWNARCLTMSSGNIDALLLFREKTASYGTGIFRNNTLNICIVWQQHAVNVSFLSLVAIIYVTSQNTSIVSSVRENYDVLRVRPGDGKAGYLRLLL